MSLGGFWVLVMGGRVIRFFERVILKIVIFGVVF